MKIADNAIKGTISTVTGLVIIVASIASVFVPELGISWTDAGIGMTFGAVLVGFIKK